MRGSTNTEGEIGVQMQAEADRSLLYFSEQPEHLTGHIAAPA